MKFPGLTLFHKSAEDFNTIVGYDDVKNIIRRALDSEESFNLLLWGEPASSKTRARQAEWSFLRLYQYDKPDSRCVGAGTTQDYPIR
jgi:hypothetical protein